MYIFHKFLLFCFKSVGFSLNGKTSTQLFLCSWSSCDPAGGETRAALSSDKSTTIYLKNKADSFKSWILFHDLVTGSNYPKRVLGQLTGCCHGVIGEGGSAGTTVQQPRNQPRSEVCDSDAGQEHMYC